MKLLERISRPRFVPMLYLGVLGSLIVAAFVVPVLLLSIPFHPFLNGMAVQPKGKTQGLHAQGLSYQRYKAPAQPQLVDREPPEGTVPRGFYPYDLAGLTEADIAKDPQLAYPQNPYPATMKNQLRGQRLYRAHCLPCHGAKGHGLGTVVAKGFSAPPSLHSKEPGSARSMVDGQLYHLIVEGRRTPDEKTGVMQVRMPGYRYSLGSEEDRWALVHFLRALQLALDPPEVTR